MWRQIVIGLIAGVAFLVLDGVLNANPLAQRLYAAYEPIARPNVNVLAGSAMTSGMAWFSLRYSALSGQAFPVGRVGGRAFRSVPWCGSSGCS